MANKIYYRVFYKEEGLREIILYYDNKVLGELLCYNFLLTNWEEIDKFLEEEDLYDVYGEDVEFINAED